MSTAENRDSNHNPPQLLGARVERKVLVRLPRNVSSMSDQENEG